MLSGREETRVRFARIGFPSFDVNSPKAQRTTQDYELRPMSHEFGHAFGMRNTNIVMKMRFFLDS